MEDTSNQRRKLYLIISTILIVLSLFPAAVLAMFSPMLFDSPGSEDNSLTIAIALSIISYPFVAILCIITSWILYIKSKKKVAAFVISYPYLHGIVILLLFVGLSIFCDGNFSC